MSQTNTLLGLDIGTVRIGVAVADGTVQIATPHGVVLVDGSEVEAISKLVDLHGVSTIVIGYPRNQSGEATQQTAFVESVAKKLEGIAEIVFQDESLTSVMAEDRLKQRKAGYKKEDIDAEAAAIILQDYMEAQI